MPRQKQKAVCVNCKGAPYRASYKYCSNLCQLEYQYKTYIENWKSGKVTGLQGLGIVSRHVKKYLRLKYQDKCCLCSCSKINPLTGKVPLVADHIDGNWRNNTVENLRLICPNCDAIGPTYAGLNRGKGRKNRMASKRGQEGKDFIDQRPN